MAYRSFRAFRDVVCDGRLEYRQSTLGFDAVINATGPDTVINRSVDPLIVSLRNDGLIAPDGLNVGLQTTTHGGCVAADGSASEHLYFRSLLRAAHWEATAATELRNHAEHLARHLVDSGT